jgi:hypothetical protein
MKKHLKVIEVAIFEELEKATGKAMLYSDLAFLVNQKVPITIGKRTMSWAMRKHIRSGLLVPVKKRIDGLETLTWELPEGVDKRNFLIISNRKQVHGLAE